MKFTRISKQLRLAIVGGFIAAVPASDLARKLGVNRNTINAWYSALRDKLSLLVIMQPDNKKAFWDYHTRRIEPLRGIPKHRQLDHINESKARYVLRKGFKGAVLSIAKDLLD